MLWIKTFFGILFQTALLGVFLYLPALTFNWPDALLFLSIHFLITILASAYLLIVKPASIEARMNYDSETQPKEDRLATVLMLSAIILGLSLAPIDIFHLNLSSSFNGNIKKFYNSVMVRSDVIIAGSNFIFSHIKKNYSNLLTEKKKLLVIFRGINVDYFKPETINTEKETKFLEKFKLDKSKKIILLPGRLTNWKGQEMFIESLNLLKTKEPNKKFIGIILGSDQGRSLFKKKLVALVEKYRLNSDVIFIDNLHEMPLAYKISDIVVSSSIEPEAFGRVSVEAQSMQKLIVASDIGGSNETIINDKTGFLFKAGDPNSLYQKLASIFDLSDDTIKYMGIEGRKNIIQKFNVEKMCFSTYSEYKKIIN